MTPRSRISPKAPLPSALLAPLLLIGCLLIPGADGEAEAQTIRGTVVSGLDGSPLAQAAIQVRRADDPDRVVGDATSDERGEFTVWVREPGEFTVRVQSLGYADSETTGLVLEENEVKTVEVRMNVDAIEIEGLEVVGERREPGFMRGVRERQRAGFGTVYTREDLEFRSGSAVQDILRTQPGMRVIRQIQNGLVGIQTGRAPPGLSRECFAAVYMDGVRVYDSSQPTTENVLDVLDLRADEVEAMEVYRGVAQVPMEFSALGADCGVVAVWTRRDFDRPPPSNGDLKYRVRFAFGGQAGNPSGDLAPDSGPGVGASLHFSIRDRFSIGVLTGFSTHDISPGTVAEFSDFVNFGGTLARGSIRMLSIGVEPRFEFLPDHRVQPVVRGRFVGVRRSAHLGSEADPDLGSFSSLGWGVGAGAGALVNITPTFGILATLDVDRYSFGPYQDLRIETSADWTNLGFGILATWSVSPIGGGL